MNTHEIRYMFEHRLLPQWFFEEKERFVGLVLQKKGILYQIIDDIFVKEKVKNPYSVEQFDMETAKITEEVMMLKLIFPAPEEEPLCYCSYLFFNKGFEKLGFFCIEKGNTFGKIQPFVCAWTQDGSHLNYGHCTFEKQNDFLRCADIYMEQEFGLKREEES